MCWVASVTNMRCASHWAGKLEKMPTAFWRAPKMDVDLANPSIVHFATRLKVVRYIWESYNRDIFCLMFLFRCPIEHYIMWTMKNLTATDVKNLFKRFFYNKFSLTVKIWKSVVFPLFSVRRRSRSDASHSVRVQIETLLLWLWWLVSEDTDDYEDPDDWVMTLMTLITLITLMKMMTLMMKMKMMKMYSPF